MLLCDTSGLFAHFDSDAREHAAVSAVIDNEPGPIVVSPYVVAELDYLVATRGSVRAELAVLRDLAGGAWDLPYFEAEDIRRATAVIERYGDQEIGLADASIVVLSGRYKTDRLLTLDDRHFRVLRTAADRAFTVLPG